MKTRFLFILMFGLGIAGCSSSNRSGGDIPSISPQSVFSLASSDSNILLLDVRTPEEFNGETGHLQGAVLIPVQNLQERISEIDSYRNYQIIPYCRTGVRSARATTLLLENGFHAVNMEGGIVRWKDEGLPVVTEKVP